MHFVAGKTTKTLSKFAREKRVNLASGFPGRDVENVTAFCVKHDEVALLGECGSGEKIAGETGNVEDMFEATNITYTCYC